MHAEQIARLLVSDRERVAVDAVARQELPFEVGGPQIVGRRGMDRHRARMDGRARAATARTHPTMPLQEIGDGTAGRPHAHLSMPPGDIVHQLLGTPRRMRVAHAEEERRQLVCDAMGTHMRRVTPLDKSRRALDGVSREPLIASLPADVIPCAELRHAVQAALMIGNKLQALGHRGHLLPGHRSPRERAAPTVECHPSSRNTLLPINPDCTMRCVNNRCF